MVQCYQTNALRTRCRGILHFCRHNDDEIPLNETALWRPSDMLRFSEFLPYRPACKDVFSNSLPH